MTRATLSRDLLIGVTVDLLSMLWGCGQHTPRLAPLSPDAVIVAFGDSLTYGTGADRDHSYPADLARLTGHRVINAGVPGELSADGAERLPAVLRRYKPELLVLCHGGNDLLRRGDPATIARNVTAMVHAARRHGVAVVLLGVPKPALFGLDAAPFYGKIAERFDLPYDGDILAKLEARRGFKSDRVHPNAAGYRLLATAVYHLLQRSGAL